MQPRTEIDPPFEEEDSLRAHCYALLARLLTSPPGDDLLGLVRNLTGDDTEFGRAVAALSAAAGTVSEAEVRSEYHDLFIGLGRGEFLPYGSYYLTGFLHEKPLARLRSDMAALGITTRGDVAEPEDHIASLCEMMAGLILGTFGRFVPLDEQRRFFDQHVGAWAPRFFQELENAEAAVFYRPVGRVGRLFMDIERDAFVLAA